MGEASYIQYYFIVKKSAKKNKKQNPRTAADNTFPS